jgi:hypothetical protein
MSGNCHKKEFAIKKATQFGYIFCQGFVCISAWFVDRSEMRQGRFQRMNWFRSKMRSGARLALFALAVQMVVSFGHMHGDDLGLPPLATSDQTQIESATTGAPGHPVNQDHHPASDDYCPVCASIALVATATPSLPPVLMVPAPIRRVWPAERPVQVFSIQVALSFQARAPPLA